MSGKPSAARRARGSSNEKRGGYGSSTKPVSQLKAPPAGPAPGAKPATGSGRKN